MKKLAEVKLKDGEDIEALIKRFKKKVQDEKIIIEFKKRQYFVKPSRENYEKEKKAKHKKFLKSIKVNRGKSNK